MAEFVINPLTLRKIAKGKRTYNTLVSLGVLEAHASEEHCLGLLTPPRLTRALTAPMRQAPITNYTVSTAALTTYHRHLEETDRPVYDPNDVFLSDADFKAKHCVEWLPGSWW